MTKNKFEKLKLQWFDARTEAYGFQEQHPETRLSADRSTVDPKLVRKCDRLWARFHKLDYKLYRYEQKQWEKKWKKMWVEPYGMFDVIPAAMNSLVRRFADYWEHGYNVHTADEDNHIAASAAEAQRLGDDAIEGVIQLEIGEISFEEYQAKLTKFFTYIAQHCWEWGD